MLTRAIPLAATLATVVQTTNALDNGLALTPPMGWMAWERFRCQVDCRNDPDNCVSERLIKEHIDILAEPEWAQAGYNRVNIDDCWSNKNRSEADDTLVANETRFPSGMKALADYAHSKQILLGIYNDVGTRTCGNYPGECKDEKCQLPGYIALDAETYAAWGIDSLKMDGCNSMHSAEVLDSAYVFIGEQLNKTGRAILYSCSWPDYIRSAGLQVNYSLTAERCNIWRMFDDIQDSYDSVVTIADWVGDNAGKGSAMQLAAGPGSWNDPDMLIIGNYALSVDEARVQMALWCIMAAPLLMGNDLRDLAPEMKKILLAKEVIAVNQDPLGVQGWRVAHEKTFCFEHDIWMKPCAGGDVAVLVWFRGVCGNHQELGFSWEQVEISPTNKRMNVRDLFEEKDLGSFEGNFSSFVNPSGVLMVKLSAA